MGKAARRIGAKGAHKEGRAQFVSIRNSERVAAVISAAELSGLLKEKTSRIGGRVSPRLVSKAKALTGIKADTELIEFALANVALEDKFAETFRAVRGSVDPDLDLGF
ncbi:MAG TPA: hypothetical protein VJ846_06900 [Sphingomicrobium sp.]|nr:hypothetical protein [Sphingomicrobium sp.]